MISQVHNGRMVASPSQTMIFALVAPRVLFMVTGRVVAADVMGAVFSSSNFPALLYVAMTQTEPDIGFVIPMLKL